MTQVSSKNNNDVVQLFWVFMMRDSQICFYVFLCGGRDSLGLFYPICLVTLHATSFRMYLRPRSLPTIQLFPAKIKWPPSSDLHDDIEFEFPPRANTPYLV